MRAIHLCLDFVPQAAAAVEAFRQEHDPLFSRIPPHITLVFPFNSKMENDLLASHARQVAGSMAPFPITLGKAEWHRPDYLWLPVVDGAGKVQAFHDKLYSGPLAGLRSGAHRYQPHVTIGRVSHPGVEIMDKAGTIPLPVEIDINEIFIERINSNLASEVLYVIKLG